MLHTFLIKEYMICISFSCPTDVGNKLEVEIGGFWPHHSFVNELVFLCFIDRAQRSGPRATFLTVP